MVPNPNYILILHGIYKVFITNVLSLDTLLAVSIQNINIFYNFMLTINRTVTGYSTCSNNYNLDS